MSTPRLFRARSLIVLATMIFVGSSSGCAEFIDPCKKDIHVAGAADPFNNNLLSGRTWTLVSVNGVPIPATGFRVPDATARLYGGSLDFRTTDWWGNDECTATFESVGNVIGTYDVHDPGSLSIPGQNAGSFHARHEAGTVTFAAAKATKTATLQGEVGLRWIIADNISIRNLGNGLYRLAFQESR